MAQAENLDSRLINNREDEYDAAGKLSLRAAKYYDHARFRKDQKFDICY